MAADILIYQADFVPVGQDQQAHVELTREVARRFNQFYKLDGREVLPEPKVLLTPSPKLPGTDGRKMSKSYGNTILLSDPEPVVRQKLKTMVTDPARVRRTDPGDPDKCPVGDLHKVFSTPETMAKVYEGCRSAGIGCIECKGWAADALVKMLSPSRSGARASRTRSGERDSERRIAAGRSPRRADHGRSARGDANDVDDRCARVRRTRQRAKTDAGGTNRGKQEMLVGPGKRKYGRESPVVALGARVRVGRNPLRIRALSPQRKS